ncbi:hypothetical protein EON64_20865, partial [archaeon]
MSRIGLIALAILLMQSLYYGSSSVNANLPPYWSKHVHEGREYFYNSQTGQTQWESPVLTSPTGGGYATSSINLGYSTPYVSSRSVLERKRREQRVRQALPKAAPASPVANTQIETSTNTKQMSPSLSIRERDDVQNAIGPHTAT